MAFDWIAIIKTIPDLVTGLGGIIKNNKATKEKMERVKQSQQN